MKVLLADKVHKQEPQRKCLHNVCTKRAETRKAILTEASTRMCFFYPAAIHNVVCADSVLIWTSTEATKFHTQALYTTFLSALKHTVSRHHETGIFVVYVLTNSFLHFSSEKSSYRPHLKANGLRFLI